MGRDDPPRPREGRQHAPLSCPEHRFLRLWPLGRPYAKAGDAPRLSRGQSRVGGPIVDLPPGVGYPDGMTFAAQLELAKLAPLDRRELLPATGYLYFFVGPQGETGQVFHADVGARSLVRAVREHEGWFFEGRGIGRISEGTERLEDRYEVVEDLEGGEALEWGYNAGAELTKVYGIYTHCQKGPEEIAAISASTQVLLLQIGEDFTGEGVWSVRIEEDDLRARRFSACVFEWGQS